MQEILVDVGEHARGCLERVVGRLKPGVVGSVLVGGMAGQDGGDIEDDGRFLKGQGILGGRLMSEGIIPGGRKMLVSLVLNQSRQGQLLPCE